jgi:serine/threonine protein kinase
MQRGMTELRTELYYLSLKAKEDFHAKLEVISGLQKTLCVLAQYAITLAAISHTSGKEVVMAPLEALAPEINVKAVSDKSHRPQMPGTPNADKRLAELYLQPPNRYNRKEIQKRKKNSDIRTELFKEFDLSDTYGILQKLEAAEAEADMFKDSNEESPGLKRERTALKRLFDDMTLAENKNDKLKTLVQRLRQVQADRGEELKEILGKMDNVVSVSNEQNRLEWYTEMTETLRKREEAVSQIRATLQAAVDLWESKRRRILGQRPGGRGQMYLVEFNILRGLGRGQFGHVFLVSKKGGIDDGKRYAMKVIEKARILQNPTSVVQAVTERLVLEAVRDCPFIISIHYALQDKEHLYLVQDYMSIDFYDLLDLKENFTEEQARFYICEIVLAVEYIHKLGIIHRDIKLENVLLDFAGHAILIDFGLSKRFTPLEGRRAYTQCGTLSYMAPEVIEEEGYSMSADWWSTGVFACELLTAESPFGFERASVMKEQLFHNILKNPPTIGQILSPEATDFITRILDKDPEMRLGARGGAEEVKGHKFFEDIDWSLVLRKEYRVPYIPNEENDLSESWDDELQLVTAWRDENFKEYSYISPSVICSDRNNDEL